jgi:hypothetical protein
MPRIAIVCALVVLALSCLTQALLANPKNAKRLNHEGRVLPEMPAIKQPALFNTPAADAILASLQVFPKDNPWNEDISKRPVLKNSAAMIARIGADAKLHGCDDMCFVLVPPDQKRIDVKLAHRGESDKGRTRFRRTHRLKAGRRRRAASQLILCSEMAMATGTFW